MSELNVVCVVCGLRLDEEHSRTHLKSIEEARRFEEASAKAEEAEVRVPA